jgi:hypothetical protein
MCVAAVFADDSAEMVQVSVAVDVSNANSGDLDESSFTKNSTASFGEGGPSVAACPWDRWSADGHLIRPRGPGSGIASRVEALQYYMTNFLQGADQFIIVQAGVALNAIVGGPHMSSNDMDLDAELVTVADSTPVLQRTTGSSAKRESKKNLGSVKVSSVKILINSWAPGMEAHGYGRPVVATGEETKTYIESKCLCVADGTQTLCSKSQTFDGDGSKLDNGRYGETYWMPLPDSKNLGLVSAIRTYVESDSWSSWRDASVRDLESWDTDGDGDISMREVLDLAASKGVNDEWLELMKTEAPCVLLNGQVGANMMLHFLKDLAAGKVDTDKIIMARRTDTDVISEIWEAPAAGVREEYGGKLVTDTEECKSKMS